MLFWLDCIRRSKRWSVRVRSIATRLFAKKKVSPSVGVISEPVAAPIPVNQAGGERKTMLNLTGLRVLAFPFGNTAPGEWILEVGELETGSRHRQNFQDFENPKALKL